MVSYEKELVSTLNHKLKGYFNTSIIANEIRMGAGIPDIGFTNAKALIKGDLPDYFAIKMMILLNDRQYIEIEELKEISGYSIALLKKTLKLLQKAGYFEREGGKFIIRRRYHLPEVEVSAIEAKLTDWKGGLFQARRYLSFADYSYLAIPCEVVGKVKVELLCKDGIGLISVDQNSIEVLIPPVKSKYCDIVCRSYFIEQMKFMNSRDKKTSL